MISPSAMDRHNKPSRASSLCSSHRLKKLDVPLRSRTGYGRRSSGEVSPPVDMVRHHRGRTGIAA